MLNAVILERGGTEGLRPLSLGCPPCLLPLLDRPLLEQQLRQLRRCGITKAAVVLDGPVEPVRSRLESGRALELELTWIRAEPGAGEVEMVRTCRDRLGEEDVLVLDGGLAVSLDLAAALAFHKVHRSAATLLLGPPPGQGLVATDGEGRVERLDRKEGGMLSTQAYTGVCILTPQALERERGGSLWSLFTALQEAGAILYGYAPEGKCRMWTDCACYLESTAELLSGHFELELDAPRIAPGVWAASPIPSGVQVVPPCYIGPDVKLGAGSLIGPHTVLGAGSTVGGHSLIQRSVLQGAAVGDRATLYGAILGSGASVRAGAVLNEGTVLGADAVVGEDAILLERVKVWPGRRVAPGARLSVSLTAGPGRGPLRFAGGVLWGVIGEELTLEDLMVLGGALGRGGTLGLGWCGGEGARMLAQAAGSGCTAAGGRVLAHDAPTPAAGAWLAESWSLPASLYLEQEGERVRIHLFDRRGMPLGREKERTLEGILERGECLRVPAGRIGRWETVNGVGRAYEADAAHRAAPPEPGRGGLTVAVCGDTPADGILARALERLGCTVLRRARPGCPVFWTQRGGFHLLARDEAGEQLGPEKLLTLVALIEYEDGLGRVAVPAEAPAAIERIAEAHRGGVLRLGRDGAEAEARYGELPWLRDAVFAACRICAHMAHSGRSLRERVEELPPFALSRREIPLHASSGAVMGRLAQRMEGAQRVGEGLRLHQKEGWLYLRPLIRRPALRVVGEAWCVEAAEELCAQCAEQVKKADAELSEEG